MDTSPVDLTATERSRVAAPLAHAWTLPPRMYTSPSVFARERQAIFAQDWLCVARVEQLPDAGDHLNIDVLDQPMVLARRTEGDIVALSNVCLHRAMPLIDQPGSGRYLTCPYHLWSYDLDGALRTAPLMEGVEHFDTEACRLPRFAVEVWEGFVFVSMRPDPAPLGPQLAGLQEHLANYRFADLAIATTLEFDSPWNWKILVENFMEAYHHIGPHRETFQPEHPASASTVEDNGGAPWALLRMPGTNRDEPIDARGDPVDDDPIDRGVVGDDADELLPPLPGLSTDQRHELLAGVVFPTFLFAATGTAGVWYQLDVASHDRMSLRIHYLLPPEVAARPAVQEALPFIAEALGHIHEEDIRVNEGPWRGLHAPSATQGRLSTYEAAIWQLNQWWLSRID